MRDEGKQLLLNTRFMYLWVKSRKGVAYGLPCRAVKCAFRHGVMGRMAFWLFYYQSLFRSLI